ncbi:exo-alpha-sialidase [Geomonas sp. Red32]|uniref:WD40/YVTN/BNR-like repeat-containing protein n=1 Tax=Geomonas sp. Red32 TaxID=2912856 RepID=UPI00202CF5C4|nr:exo-alpha-sialidase [Geomonas sp. Red32]MCM0083802.1 exo-alpha-sialidase [Geomonas sp. Red32]
MRAKIYCGFSKLCQLLVLAILISSCGGGGGNPSSQIQVNLVSKSNWHGVDELSNSPQLHAVGYADNLFFAVGIGYNYIQSSADGVTWSILTNSYDLGNLKDFASNGNELVAVGGADTVITSDDNFSTFQTYHSGIVEYFNTVSYGNGIFIASGATSYGESCVIMTSTDGIHWTSRLNQPLLWIFKIVYGDGTFVAVGSNESGGIVMTSVDNGTTWVTRQSGLSNSFSDIAYGHNTFVAVGGGGAILTSTDAGTTWTSSPSGTTYGINGITFGKGVFAAVSGDYSSHIDQILVSNDNGVHWSVMSFTGQYWLNKIAYGNGRFVAVGNYGLYYSDTF